MTLDEWMYPPETGVYTEKNPLPVKIMTHKRPDFDAIWQEGVEQINSYQSPVRSEKQVDKPVEQTERPSPVNITDNHTEQATIFIDDRSQRYTLHIRGIGWLALVLLAPFIGYAGYTVIQRATPVLIGALHTLLGWLIVLAMLFILPYVARPWIRYVIKPGYRAWRKRRSDVRGYPYE